MTERTKSKPNNLNGWIRTALWGLLVSVSITLMAWLRYDVCELRGEIKILDRKVATVQTDVSWLKGAEKRRENQ